jgi:phosphoserine phosphatase
MNYVLISVSGPDQPGITSKLMEIVARNNHRITDMGQSVTHRLLSLSFVIEINGRQTSVLKDLLFEAKNLGQDLDFTLLDSAYPSEHYKDLREAPARYILTCVSDGGIPSHFLADISQTLAANTSNIARIDNLRPQSFTCLEFSIDVPPATSLQKLKENLLAIGNHHKIDLALIKDNAFRRNKRLIVFDMDSTLIQNEVIDEMAAECGVKTEVALITERAMNGEIDFDQSLRERVALLAGLPVERLKDVAARIKLTHGVEEFLTTVKALGYKVAIISGGFSYFADALKNQLHIDFAFSNELEIVNGKLTGQVLGTIVNGDQKALLVQFLAQQERISLEQVVAIGDGANDLKMLARAGLGIAFHAKEIVRQQAQQQLSHGNMANILYFLGISGPVEP